MFNVACNIDSMSSDWSREGLPPLSHYVTAPLGQGRSLDSCRVGRGQRLPSMFNVACNICSVGAGSARPWHIPLTAARSSPTGEQLFAATNSSPVGEVPKAEGY